MPAQKMAEPKLVGCGKTWFPGEDVLVHPGSRISVKKQPDIRTVCSELMRPAAQARLSVARISVVEGRGRRGGGGGKAGC